MAADAARWQCFPISAKKLYFSKQVLYLCLLNTSKGEFMRFLFCMATLVLLTSVSASASNDVEVDQNGFQKALSSSILESSILDHFWLGDDGVDCGEPKIELLVVNYKKNTITFLVHPAAKNYTCEQRSMTCELDFTQTKQGSIILPDSPVFLNGLGCFL